MNALRPPLPSFLRRLHGDESGAALTEFAITLPIFLAFTVGILNLHDIHQNLLISEQRASAELWEDAIDAQTSAFGKPPSPFLGGPQAMSTYSSLGDLMSIPGALDVTTNFAGVYGDSGTKTMAMNAVPGVNMDSDPKLTLNQILCNSNSHAYTLLNDLNPIGGASLAAGLRYGVVSGQDTVTFQTERGADWRSIAGETDVWYVASTPTAPTDHVVGLIFTQLEIRSEDAWQDTVAFGMSNWASSLSGVSTCN